MIPPRFVSLFLVFSIACLPLLGVAKQLETLPENGYESRTGVPNVAAKLRNGEPVTMVFIGGSITQNSASFATTFPQWMEEKYPESQIKAINAGISGTPSKFGAARFDRDVLVHDPDLVFIEFAVNDGNGTTSDQMERMVRKAWQHDPSMDLVFIYTIRNNHLEDYAAGHLPVAASSHERVAEHYYIPTIAMGFEPAKKINAGEWTIDEFAKDGVHPSLEGYQYYQDMLEKAMGSMFASTVEYGPRKLENITFFTPSLVVYPPEPKVEPMPEPEAMLNEDGVAAKQTWELPVVGKHWINDPEFTVDGQPLWRLYVASRNHDTNKAPALKRDLWTQEIGWLAEELQFSGPEGAAFFEPRKGSHEMTFGTRRKDIGILAFVAPVDGYYEMEFSADYLEWWKGPDHSATFNVALA